MKNFRLLAMAVVLGASSAPSEAAYVTLKFDGNVNDINGYPIEAPVGQISVGDAFSIQVTFNQSAVESPYTLNDPNVSVNYGDVFWQVNFDNFKARGWSGAQGIVVFNDYKLCDGCMGPYDSFGIPTMILGSDKASSAFDLGSGNYLNSFGINLFDLSPDIWPTDAMPKAIPLEKMKMGSVSFTFYQANTQRLVGVWSYLHQGLRVSQSFSAAPPAVPEGPTWLLMLFGFLGAGVALRGERRRRSEV